MDQVSDKKAFPRRPTQQRAKDRFEHVLEAAQDLLRDRGLAGFSIPELAVRLGYSRATIYNFFPTPYSIFNELTRRYLTQLEALLADRAEQLPGLPWQDRARAMTACAADFYNRNPVACLLILGGPTTHDSYRAQELMIQRLGLMVQTLLAQHGFTLPPPPPNISFLAVEMGTTCYRVSFFLHGRITPEYAEEAAGAMIAYLSRYVPG